MRLVVEKRTRSDHDQAVNSVRQSGVRVEGAPKTLTSVKLGDQTVDRKQYAWDGQTLWINANLSQTTTLRLEFAGEMR